MNELFNLVNELRNRIERYRGLLSANECLNVLDVTRTSTTIRGLPLAVRSLNMLLG